MAKIINTIGGITKYEPGQTVQDISNIASTALRLKIIADRYIRGFEKADINGPLNAYERETFRQGWANIKEHRRRLGRETEAGIELKSNEYESEKYIPNKLDNKKQQASANKNVVTIVDLDYKDEQGNKRIKKLDLQFRPTNLQVNIESAFTAVATPGRNNPFYNYGGSEDSISFDISFYAKQENREDVIFKCKWLESLTKADGYASSPHRVKLIWGTGKLFFEDTWLLVSAPYVLTHFIDKGYTIDANGNKQIKNYGLLPTVATQQLTFKKLVTKNLTYEDIIGKGDFTLNSK